MNGQFAKKIRKLTKAYTDRAWREFYDAIYQQPLRVRLRIAWAILRKTT